MKFFGLFPVPAGVTTATRPVVAPLGTVAVMVVSEFSVKTAWTPWNFTAVAPVKFVPVIVTVVPTGPVVGERLVTVGSGGGGVTVKLVPEVAVPPRP